MDDEWNLNGSTSSGKLNEDNSEEEEEEDEEINEKSERDNSTSQLILEGVVETNNGDDAAKLTTNNRIDLNLNQLNHLITSPTTNKILLANDDNDVNNDEEDNNSNNMRNEDDDPLKVNTHQIDHDGPNNNSNNSNSDDQMIVNVVESLIMSDANGSSPNAHLHNQNNSNSCGVINLNDTSLTVLLNSANIEEKGLELVNLTPNDSTSIIKENDDILASGSVSSFNNDKNKENEDINKTDKSKQSYSNSSKNRFSYKCKNCSYLTKFKAHIIEHMQLEHSINLMQCPNTNCNKKFKDEWKLKRHLKSSKDHPINQHQQFSDLNDCMKLYVEIKALKIGLYPCPLCFMVDPINQPNHVVYYNQPHQLNDYDKQTDNLIYLNTYEELREHLTQKHPDFNPDSFIICKQCGQVFINRYKLSCHVFNVHSGKRKPRAKKSTLSSSNDIPIVSTNKKLKKSLTIQKFNILPERKYTCIKCTRKFKRTRDLQIHIQIMHKDITEEERQQTQLEIQKINQLIKSNSYHLSHHVINQSKISTSNENNNENNNNKICKVCNKVFKSLNSSSNSNVNKSYIRHMQIQHGLNEKGERLIECPVCEKSFFNRQQLERHIHTHEVWVPIPPDSENNTNNDIKIPSYSKTNVEMPDFKDKHSILYCHECVECKLYFKSIKVLHRHKKEMHNLKPVYRCALQQCMNEFDKCDLFLEHAKIHPQKNIACLKCKIKFANKNLLRHHMKNVHYNHKLKTNNSENKPNRTNNNILKENAISNKINNISTTSNNNNTNNKTWEFSCPTCGKECQNRNSLHNHIATHSTNDLRLFMCDLCGHSFKTRKDLSRHAALHDMTKHKMCQECGMTFKTSFHLKRHTLTRHSNIRPFTCVQCDMTFARKDKLKQHEAKHINHPLYECKQCGKGFYRKEHLKDHEISKHSKQYPFSCEHCAKGFVHAKDLHRHIRVRHLNSGNNIENNSDTIAINKKTTKTIANSGKTNNKKLNNLKNQQIQQQQNQHQQQQITANQPSMVAAAVAAMSGQNIRLVTGQIFVPIQSQQQQTHNYNNNALFQQQQQQSITNNQSIMNQQQHSQFHQQQQQVLQQPIKTSISANDFKCKKISSILKSTLYLSNQKQINQLQQQQQPAQQIYQQNIPQLVPPINQTPLSQIQLNNFSTNTNNNINYAANNNTNNNFIINTNNNNNPKANPIYKPFNNNTITLDHQFQPNQQNHIVNLTQFNPNHNNQYFNNNHINQANNNQSQIISIPIYSTTTNNNNNNININNNNNNNINNFIDFNNLSTNFANEIITNKKTAVKKTNNNKKLKLNDFQTTNTIDNTIDSILNSLNDSKNETNNKKQHKCLHCTKQFSYENQLKKHIESKHKSTDSPIALMFSCSICSQQFPTKQLAKTHCDKSHLSYKCSACSKSFKIKSHCQRHITTAHSITDNLDTVIIENRLDAKIIEPPAQTSTPQQLLINDTNFLNYNPIINRNPMQNDLKDYLLNKDMNINLNDINLNFVDNIWTTSTSTSSNAPQLLSNNSSTIPTLVLVNNNNPNNNMNENLVDTTNNSSIHHHIKNHHQNNNNNNTDVLMSNLNNSFFLA